MLLRAIDVDAGYGGEPVLKDIGFRVEPGQLVAILGPNGAGKSTLIRCLSRTLRPEAGQVQFDGVDLYSLTAREAAKRIAVVPQFEEPVFDFTVREIVEMGRFAAGDSFGEAVESALEATTLTELADRPFTTLSGGERQRVLVARALAQDTPVILLDEPTAHMDVGFQIATLSLLRKLSHDGRAVAAALHDLNLASGFADRAVLLYSGRIVADGPVEEVLCSAEIERVYGASFERVRDERTGRIIVVPELVPERSKTQFPRRIHLVGGGGSAAPILTELWQIGHKLSLGITHVSDSDYEAAVRLGVPCVAAPPFSKFTSEQREEALRLALDAEAVVVCPSPYGTGNLENIVLLEDLASRGMAAWIIERPRGDWDFSGGEAEKRLGRIEFSRSRVVAASELAALLENSRL